MDNDTDYIARAAGRDGGSDYESPEQYDALYDGGSVIRVINDATGQVIGSYNPERYHFEPEADPKPPYVQRRRCDNCGEHETDGNPVRTTVIDSRTEHICDKCVDAHDWSDWYQAPNRTYIHN